MTLDDFVLPVPWWNRDIWTCGHHWSGREPATYRFDPAVSRRPHTGIDLAAPQGTAIVAPAPGIVTSSGWSNAAAGYVVSIRHDVIYQGAPRRVWSRHCHCLATGLARVGKAVAAGERVASVGSTGASAGPHDHHSLFLDVEFPNWQTQRHLMLDPEPVYSPGKALLMMEGHPYPEDVKRLQRRLNAVGYDPPLDVDGDYGPETSTAVRWFQTKVHLHVSGEASPITLAILFSRRVPA